MRIGNWWSWSKVLGSGATVVATVLVAGLVSTTPAQASVSQGYIKGVAPVNDDWGDEGPLSRTQHANSGATGLWQVVLYTYGYLASTDIDCQFGPKTEAATKSWQQAHGLTADGIVGPATFGRADNDLIVSGGTLYYYGSRRAVELWQWSDGTYLFPRYPGQTSTYYVSTPYGSTPGGC